MQLFAPYADTYRRWEVKKWRNKAVKNSFELTGHSFCWYLPKSQAVDKWKNWARMIVPDWMHRNAQEWEDIRSVEPLSLKLYFLEVQGAISSCWGYCLKIKEESISIRGKSLIEALTTECASCRDSVFIPRETRSFRLRIFPSCTSRILRTEVQERDTRKGSCSPSVFWPPGAFRCSEISPFTSSKKSSCITPCMEDWGTVEPTHGTAELVQITGRLLDRNKGGFYLE